MNEESGSYDLVLSPDEIITVNFIHTSDDITWEGEEAEAHSIKITSVIVNGKQMAPADLPAWQQKAVIDSIQTHLVHSTDPEIH